MSAGSRGWGSIPSVGTIAMMLAAPDRTAVRRPRALDLFCGAGGVSVGLERAGFDVVWVDLFEQPEYPTSETGSLRFLCADALEIPLVGFDFVASSPPCQKFTAYRRKGHGVGDRAKNLIPAIRKRLRAAGVPYAIENVEGAPLRDPVTLCGSMFGLDVRRHRCFETNFPLAPPFVCDHSVWTPRFPCATNRTNLRRTVEVGVWRIPLAVQPKAMGIDWMSLRALSQAIPPAYAEWIGKRALAAMGRAP